MSSALNLHSDCEKRVKSSNAAVIEKLRNTVYSVNSQWQK